MGGPAEQKVNTVFIPPGEGRQTFSPLPLAWHVENLEVGPEGILTSIVGPSILRVKRQTFTSSLPGSFEGIPFTIEPTSSPLFGFKSGQAHSVFSARLQNGGANLILYRVGSKLYSFNGSMDDADDILIRGLSSSPASKTLDQYIVINDRVVYFNGVDRPKVISYDGNVSPLGFSRRAATPSVASPGQPSYDDKVNYFPNSMGYSWQGNIGTPGDLLTGQKAAVLKGSWYYFLQYEDINGNLSEFSLPSEAATIHTNQADPLLPVALDKKEFSDGTVDVIDLLIQGNTTTIRSIPSGTEIDDLTRRFLIDSCGDAPEHTVAVRVFRTRDTLHKDPTPRFVARVPGRKQFTYDDNNSDVGLGRTWQQTISVPVFRVACAHQGRLIIANTLGDPGIVRRSQPGFPGTFNEDEYIYPDSGGDQITALTSHNGNLIAFTSQSTYLIGDDFMAPRPLAKFIGCVAPKSIQTMKDGTLVWLGLDGFYGLGLDGTLKRLSQPIDKIFARDLNKSQLFRAASVIDQESGEYRCAIAEKGKKSNTVILCFDGQFWRRQSLGIEIADMCSSADHTKVTLAVGTDIREKDLLFATSSTETVDQDEKAISPDKVDVSRIFILNRQSTDYFAPPRRIRYRSAWLRSAEFGLVPTNVRNLYVGMLDAWVGVATIRLYRNGSWDPIATMEDVLLSGPDDGSGIVSDVAGSAIVGEAKTRDPRLFWRQIPVDIQNANSWAFEIEIVGSPSPTVPDVSTPSKLRREKQGWANLFSSYAEGEKEYIKRSQDLSIWELGRMKIAAFAFDVSVATKGSPMGRVPFRQDK